MPRRIAYLALLTITVMLALLIDNANLRSGNGRCK